MTPLLFVILLQAAAAPAPAPAAAADDPTTVVVTAPLPTLKAAWERCREGKCSTRADVVASIRYAEVQFRGGRYVDARHTLQEAIDRVRPRAESEPVAVAALYEATTTIATHDGEQDVAARASGNRVALLRTAFGPGDPRTLQAELDDIDLQAGLGHRDDAQTRYAALEKRARAAGQEGVAAAALLRRAAADHANGDDAAAQRRLQALSLRSGAGTNDRLAGQVMQARIAQDRGDRTATDAFARSGAIPPAASAARPVLLWQPPLPSPIDPASGDGYDLRDRTTQGAGAVAAHWVDIGYRIDADGRVGNATVLRGDGRTGWAKSILSNIEARRYAPVAGASADRWRVERWSLTADYETPTGSLVRQRSRRPHYVVIDVSDQQPTRIEAKPAAAPNR